ncbi:hypothetical protein BDV37DRAFT_266043 [Aspergillus pseudonomiae]|uniref:Uncharacterized protein n=1 Tax=Aspergillus pseudonomiae TaxID=1506151 RepID=A0A5N7CT27_9EURO|nr:uncharacterized protein BDV37DRAFT_266043 [Aspergillus pseudonomiae]KAE8397305.1 hypothetical protein BDV37DRAFT_266043 [Aspergillus pseudonomiae]
MWKFNFLIFLLSSVSICLLELFKRNLGIFNHDGWNSEGAPSYTTSKICLRAVETMAFCGYNFNVQSSHWYGF